MSRPLTTLPDPLPVNIQHERNGDKRHANKGQGGARPRYPQVRKHGIGKEREAGTKTRAHEVVPRVCGGGVNGVCVANVVEDGIEEEECSDGEECRADYWDDPLRWCGVSLWLGEEEKRVRRAGGYIRGYSLCSSIQTKTDR